MERAVHSGKLSDAVFARATPGDDAEIRALLRRVPMRGDLQIGFGREPSVFACEAPAGCVERMMVARRDRHMVGVGAWSERAVWLGGERRVVGYLHGLRLVPKLARSMRVLREGYRFLAGEIGEVDAALWFTSIDAANARARQVLESRVSGLPRYEAAAEYLTKVWPVRGRNESVSGMETREEVTDFLNREGTRYDLSLVWDDARWQALERTGFDVKDVVVVRDGGKVVALAGVWDQRAWRQVVVHAYPRSMRVARPFLRMWGARLPKEGAVAAMGQVFPFAVAKGAENAVGKLWYGVQSVARSRGIDWLALGLDAGDPQWKGLPPGLVSYSTLLYQVHGHGFPEQTKYGLARLVRPESAML